jgi:transcriptional regulator with XRE-family HTH domain
MINNTLADLLKKAREEKSWSQTELAEELRKSRALIAQWESNILEPSDEDAKKLSELLDIDHETLLYQIEVSRFKRRFFNLVKDRSRLNASTIKQIVEQISFEEVWNYQRLEKQLQSSHESERVHAFRQLGKGATFLQNLVTRTPERKVQRYTVRVRGAIRVSSNTAAPEEPSIPVYGTGIALGIENGPAIERPAPTVGPRFVLRLHGTGGDFSIYENCRMQVAVEKEKMRLELATVTPEVTSQELKVNIEVPLSGIEVPSGVLPTEVIDLQFLVNEEGGT